jgi:hypothetical protein
MRQILAVKAPGPSLLPGWEMGSLSISPLSETQERLREGEKALCPLGWLSPSAFHHALKHPSAPSTHISPWMSHTRFPREAMAANLPGSNFPAQPYPGSGPTLQEGVLVAD